ncbi:serine/threonine-protein kinase [Thermopolyspora sp. NPDC052614]|uniref:serine/threonine-protein kinase n=1 Tax=Thermopolyspora sp. NPDC052614 TaxID=3155682 RepID=UPI003433FD1F
MRQVTAPERRPDDPESVDGNHVVGRLGAGANAVVLLVRRPSGEQAVLKLFHAAPADAGVLAEVEALRRLPVTGVAQILGIGVYGERPYILAEHVPGPSLRRSIERDGPLDGPAPHRLAVATMTALVSLHQGGVAHRELTPDNIIWGPDGPRLINLGAAHVLGAGGMATRSFRGGGYFAPEELTGTVPGTAADVFAWGAIMVYAASGRAPFAGASMTETMSRVLHDEPDLGVLPEELRGPVAACLAKDPAARPTAEEVLFRLAGDSRVLGTHDFPAGPYTTAALPYGTGETTPPADRTRRPGRVLALVAAGAVLAGVSGAVGYWLAPRGTATVDPVAASPRPETATPTATPVPVASPDVIDAASTPPAKATKRIRLSEGRLTLRENPSDPLIVTSYTVADGRVREAHVREPGGDGFRLIAKDGDNGEAVVSPDGAWIAVNPWNKFATSSTDFLVIINRRTGERFTVNTAEKPLQGLYAIWSRDSRRVLVSLYRPDGKTLPNPRGFVIVDVATRRATVVTTGGERDDRAFFGWTPDGTGVVSAYAGKGELWGLRFRDLRGRVGRIAGWVGESPLPDRFSPSGRSFLSYCPKSHTTLCVWNTATGARTATVPVWDTREAVMQGWWDENHVIVADYRKDPVKYVVVNLDGTPVRTLAELPAKDGRFIQLRFSRR